MNSNEYYIKQGISHLDRQYKIAMRCPICGCHKLNVQDIVWEWIDSPPRVLDLDSKRRGVIQNLILERYNKPKDVCSFNQHHISYVFDITMWVCTDCHTKIHHSNKEPFVSFKPWDSMGDKRYYD